MKQFHGTTILAVRHKGKLAVAGDGQVTILDALTAAQHSAGLITLTGIDFTNTVVENQSKNYYLYEYMYNGGGVAVGDIDNDGYLRTEKQALLDQSPPGITELMLDQALDLLDWGLDGVMIGRAAYHQPADILCQADRRIFGQGADSDPADAVRRGPIRPTPRRHTGASTSSPSTTSPRI